MAITGKNGSIIKVDADPSAGGGLPSPLNTVVQFGGAIFIKTSAPDTGWTNTGGGGPPTGNTDTISYFNAAGTLASNTSAKFNGVLNSMAFGISVSGGVISAIAEGSSVFGRANTGSISVNNVAGVGASASGAVESSGAITSENKGAFAHGFASSQGIANGTMRATNTGSIAMGVSQGFMLSSGVGSVVMGNSDYFSTELNATGRGSIVLGAAGDTVGGSNGVIQASSVGSMARGHSRNGFLHASNFGSFASGYALGNGGTILASGFGSHALGHTADTGNITASGPGSLATGAIVGNGGAIQATGVGSFAGGRSDSALTSVVANNIGTFAYGTEMLASGQYAACFGRGNVASGLAGFIVGRYALNATQNSGSATGTDYAFAVGNGTSAAARSNAFQIDKDGRMTNFGSMVRKTTISGPTAGVLNLNISVRTDDTVICDCSGAGTFTLNLPSALGEAGLNYTFVAGGGDPTGKITIVPTGGKVLDVNVKAFSATVTAIQLVLLGNTWYQTN